MEKFYCGTCGEEVNASEKKCPSCGVEFAKEVSDDSDIIVHSELTFDDKVKNTVLGLEKVANVLKTLSIFAAIILFLIGLILSSEAEEGGGVVFVVYTIYSAILLANAYISYLIFNWFSHMLNCVYQISKKKK